MLKEPVLEPPATPAAVREFGHATHLGRVIVKLVIAIINPFKLDEERDALTLLDVQGLTVSEVNGCGSQRVQTQIYRGPEYEVNFLPKMKPENVVSDDMAYEVTEANSMAANSETTGGGKLFALGIEREMRVRTRELDVAEV
jgi:nitrogen regulatory protein PII